MAIPCAILAVFESLKLCKKKKLQQVLRAKVPASFLFVY